MRGNVGRRWRQWLVMGIGVAVIGALAAPAEARRTIYEGQIQCEDRGSVSPLAGAEVRLYTRGADPFPIHHLDDLDYTNSRGEFSLRAIEQEGDHFMTVALRDRQNVRLKTWMGINDWSITRHVPPNRRDRVNLGAWLLRVDGKSHPCSIWQAARDAYADYRGLTGERPPSGGGLLVQNDAIGGGVPWTAHVEIYWAENYDIGPRPGDGETVRHEFGHVIRHGHDGDSTHFFGDIIEHGYARHHGACSKTGLGFAFNEGWAQYWARGWWPSPGCAGEDPDDFTIEGHVSRALADLEQRCFRGDRAAMVGVLKRNRGTIHSFQQFRDAAGCPGAPVLMASNAVEAAVPAIEPAEDTAESAGDKRKAVDAEIRELRRDLRSAQRRAANLPTCREGACERALRDALRPAQLRAEIAQLQLLRRTLARYDTVEEVDRFRALGLGRITEWMQKRERAIRRGAARIAAKQLRSALKAGSRLFRIDKSRAARRLRNRLLQQRRRLLRVERGRGDAAAVLDLDLPPVGVVRRVKPKTFENLTRPPLPVPTPLPSPGPQPPAPQPQASQLTLTCPPPPTQGKGTVTGTLTPPRPGATIQLRITPPPPGTATTQTATVQPDGTFSSDILVTDPGTTTVTAEYAGDATTLPSSAKCETGF